MGLHLSEALNEPKILEKMKMSSFNAFCRHLGLAKSGKSGRNLAHAAEYTMSFFANNACFPDDTIRWSPEVALLFENAVQKLRAAGLHTEAMDLEKEARNKKKQITRSYISQYLSDNGLGTATANRKQRYSRMTKDQLVKLCVDKQGKIDRKNSELKALRTRLKKARAKMQELQAALSYCAKAPKELLTKKFLVV